MNKYTKKEFIQECIDKLKIFDTKIGNRFICPTCLRLIDQIDVAKISVAHILPKSAAGMNTTLICKTCNSNFGMKQDKWFGEYLNYLEDGLLSNKVTKKSFSIDSIPINGKYNLKDGCFDFYINYSHNSPEIQSQIENHFLSYRPSIEMKITIPLLEKDNDIKIGFLTAAYLYGFHRFGYSWIFQNYSDNIRKTIISRELKDKAFFHISETSIINKQPTFSIAIIENDCLLVSHIYNRLIFFSPVYDNNVIDIIIKSKSNSIRTIIIDEIPMFDYKSPFGISYGGKYLLFPGIIDDVTKIKLIEYSDSNNNIDVFNLAPNE